MDKKGTTWLKRVAVIDDERFDINCAAVLSKLAMRRFSLSRVKMPLIFAARQSFDLILLVI
jgi:hypothetical protein